MINVPAKLNTCRSQWTGVKFNETLQQHQALWLLGAPLVIKAQFTFKNHFSLGDLSVQILVETGCCREFSPQVVLD